MDIHARIRRRREALGLSMEKLAQMVGVKAWQTVQQWERPDGTAPKRARLDQVAAALETTSEWLLFGGPDTATSAGKSHHDKTQRTSATAAKNEVDWPFKQISRTRWSALPERTRRRAEQAALNIVALWEEENSAPIEKPTGKSHRAA